MGSNWACVFPDDILGILCQYMPNSSLKQCCLTSRTFRYLSRPLLFERLTIQTGPYETNPSEDAFRFWEALRLDPQIGTLVKSLTLLHADGRSSNHWFTSFEVIPKLPYIMTHLPNLSSFSIERYSMPPWGRELYWDLTVWTEMTSAIQHILNLPTLKNFHFYERFEFTDPDSLHQLLRLTRPSGIRSLQLCGCKLEETNNTYISLVPAAYSSKIENLRLYYIDQDPNCGLALISSLTSPASSFDITNLSSLELWAIGVEDDTWIPAILDAQKNDFTLQHLGLFAVEGYPENEGFIHSLSRFTSICKLSISEANSPIFDYDTKEVEGIVFGFAAAWMSVLPTNIVSTVEELDIHIEASNWSTGPLGVDEILSSDALNLMQKVQQVRLHVEERSGKFDVDMFLREEWNSREDIEPSHELDQATLRKWVASVVLPRTYSEGKVAIDYQRTSYGS
ncbi:hypothetical protein DL96DRAFT_1676743 [Flagelloscypha sp. PMI_526]|nr:hypothetical protein DL96DRAFT_1676743 [Flagelloscypha sp. PMI_526]